jgi:hypothetical protein
MHPRSSPNIATTRVHPSDSAAGGRASRRRAADQPPPAVYTVWKRSSMGFQGTDGFCVYDAAGSLAFRVDNYSRRRKLFAGELLLMDGHGAPLLALRPQVIHYSSYLVIESSSLHFYGPRMSKIKIRSQTISSQQAINCTSILKTPINAYIVFKFVVLLGGQR